MENKHMLKAISLFSGAGGMDVGVLQAGFEILSCVELDQYCCETQRANIERSNRNTTVYEIDIRDLEPKQLLLDNHISRGELDLLFGGPPCQAFSQIGKQESLHDERGLLLFEMVRFAREIEPKVIMLEQVKGLISAKDLSGKRGGVFRQFLSELEALGYTVSWQVMLAANYGVPQKRERVIIVAIKHGNKFIFPPPTHTDIAPSEMQMSLFGLSPFTTVGDVISDLPAPVVRDSCVEIPENSHYDVTPPRDRERIHFVPEGMYLSSQTHLPKSILGNLSARDTTKFLRTSRYKVANTLRGGEIFYHPTEDRYLTPREYMRIHGYPDSYILKGPIRGRTGTVKKLDQHRQIGNSVPPPLAKAVSDQIKKVLTDGENI